MDGAECSYRLSGLVESECRNARPTTGSRSAGNLWQRLQKRKKLLQHAMEPEHERRGPDESRLAEWVEWLKHAPKRIACVGSSSTRVRRLESRQSKQVVQNTSYETQVQTGGWGQQGNQQCAATVQLLILKEFVSCSVSRGLERRRSSSACPESCCSRSHDQDCPD